MLPPQRDRARVAADQLASKAYFRGEASGFHLARALGQFEALHSSLSLIISSDTSKVDAEASPQELEMLKERFVGAIKDIAEKKTGWTIPELKRLLFRCASAIVSLKWVGWWILSTNAVLILTNSVTENYCIISSPYHLKRSIRQQCPQELKHGLG